MFWVRIRLGKREYLGVLDTGATISIVAKKTLPCGSLKNTMATAAIRMGDGHVVHSCGDCEVEVPMGSRTIAHRFYVMDTEAFDFVLETDFFVQHSQIQSLTLQAPYLLYVDHGSGRESVPLEQSEHTSSYLRLSKEEPSNMMAASKTEDYQLLGEVLDQGLKELGYSREDLSVELFASNKQHVLDLYCSKGKNCSYKFYWPSFGMAYGNPRFSELGKVLTKVALERSRMVLCSPDWGAHGGNEYWRNLLDRLTISSVRLPDEAIYVPLGRKTPIGKPGWGSMLSVVDGGLTSIPWEDLDPTLVQAIQRESDGLALGDLKDRLRPQDAVETTPGGDEYVVTDTNAPNSPCHVPVPDGVSEYGLSELPSSIHSDDETGHDAFFVQTCVEEVRERRVRRPTETPTLHEGGRPRGRGAGPSIQAQGVCGFQEEVGGEKAMLREAYPQLMATEARTYGRPIPIEGGPRTEDHHLAKGGRSQAYEERVGRPCEDPRGGRPLGGMCM